jgi:glutaredoxin 3
MQVTVYSTPTCPFCKQVKAFLEEHAVSYTDADVSTNQALAEEMIQKTGQMGVPVVMIGEEMVIGFDEIRLKELLNIS